MNKQIRKIRNFVQRNKSAFVVAAITIPVIYVQHTGIRSLNSFLEEKGLLGEYYNLDEE